MCEISALDPLRPARISFLHRGNHAVVSKAEMVAVADNNVIEHLNTDHLACLDQPPGEQDVLLARFDVAARVVVDEYDRRRGFTDGGLEGLTGMNKGGGKTSH